MRAYLRLDPHLVERKLAKGYSPAQVAAYVMLLTQAEQQVPRGRFKSLALVKAAMDCMVEQGGKRCAMSLHLPFLMEQGDLVRLTDCSYYVEGWDEWEEGNWQVAERMRRVRDRKSRIDRNGSYGGDRNGSPNGVTAETVMVSSERIAESGGRRAASRERNAVASSGDQLAAGKTDPRTDAVLQRFAQLTGRPASTTDEKWAGRIPYEYPRLTTNVLLTALEEAYSKLQDRNELLQSLRYLAGRYADLEQQASDNGLRPVDPGASR